MKMKPVITLILILWSSTVFAKVNEITHKKLETIEITYNLDREFYSSSIEPDDNLIEECKNLNKETTATLTAQYGAGLPLVKSQSPCLLYPSDKPGTSKVVSRLTTNGRLIFQRVIP